jgi:aerobic-type carbon monoxide dehydrogenase small subunit (CoxS/CutS family)
MSRRFVRLGEDQRPGITLYVDGQPISALEGDTLMVALLSAVGTLRQSEFGEERRAGFCLMGACQDCWVWTENGDRLRACSTSAETDQRILTSQPEASWPNLG